jgi:transcription termination factor NusB
MTLERYINEKIKSLTDTISKTTDVKSLKELTKARDNLLRLKNF